MGSTQPNHRLDPHLFSIQLSCEIRLNVCISLGLVLLTVIVRAILIEIHRIAREAR